MQFEGAGLAEDTTSCRTDVTDREDEFDYVFSGGQRSGDTHAQVFKAQPVPAHLVTHVRSQALNALIEEDEEDEGEEEEEERDKEELQQHQGSREMLGSTGSQPADSASEQFQTGQQQAQSHAVHAAHATLDTLPSSPAADPTLNTSGMPTLGAQQLSTGLSPQVSGAVAAAHVSHASRPPPGTPMSARYQNNSPAESPSTADFDIDIEMIEPVQDMAGAWHDRTWLVPVQDMAGAGVDAKASLKTGHFQEFIHVVAGSSSLTPLASNHHMPTPVNPHPALHSSNPSPASAGPLQPHSASDPCAASVHPLQQPGRPTQPLPSPIPQPPPHQEDEWELANQLINNGGPKIPGLQVVRPSSSPVAQPHAQPHAQLPSQLPAQLPAQPPPQSDAQLDAQPNAQSNAQPNAQPDARPPAQQQQESEADEWEVANQQVVVVMQDSNQTAQSAGAGTSKHGTASLISSSQALQQLRAAPLEPVQASHAEASLSKPAGLFARLFCGGPPPLPSVLQQEQVRLLCWSRTSFSEQEPLHWQLLESCFCAFTGKHPGGVARHGTHWDLLGFQGNDPATDLRSCGILGLLQLLSLHNHNHANAATVYRLSRSATQEFPLAVVSLNMTKHALQALRDGRLNAAALHGGDMCSVVASFHAGAMYMFYNTWLTGGKTMLQSGYVMKDVELRCKTDTAGVLQTASTVLQEC